MNVFDELNGLEDLDANTPELAGGFSSIAKELKRGIKKIKTVNSKIAHKILPSSVIKIGKKIDDSGALKIAAGIGALAVGVPMLMPALSAAGGAIGAGAVKAGAIAAKGFGAVKGVLTATKITAAAKAVTTVKSALSPSAAVYGPTLASQASPEVQNEVAQQTANAANTANALAQAMAVSPKFNEAYNALKAQGYNDDQILAHWIESKSFYMAATASVSRAVYPTIAAQAAAVGMPAQYVEEYATARSDEIADAEVKKIQSGDSTALLLAAGAAFLMMKGGL